MKEAPRPQPEPRPLLSPTPLERVQIAKEARENVRRTKNADVFPLELRQGFNAGVAQILIEQGELPDTFHWASRMSQGEVLHDEFGEDAIEIFNAYEQRTRTTR